MPAIEADLASASSLPVHRHPTTAPVFGYSKWQRGVARRRARESRQSGASGAARGGQRPNDYDASVGERSATPIHEGGMRFAAETGTGRRPEFGGDPGQNRNSPARNRA